MQLAFNVLCKDTIVAKNCAGKDYFCNQRQNSFNFIFKSILCYNIKIAKSNVDFL